MYEEHSAFDIPGNENVKVWRYMDFTKFIYLLEYSSLFFSRADRFSDPFEGAFTLMNYEQEPRINVNGKEHKIYFDALKKFQKHSYLNCWHMNDYESAAMWSLYLKSNEGIAIQSTYKKLCNSITDSRTIHIGKVRYIDYDKEIIPVDFPVYRAFLHKRKSFSHETELRCYLNEFNIINDAQLNIDVCKYEFGTNVSVELNVLLENVYIAPTAPQWLTTLVVKLLEKYNTNVSVKKSTLYDSPLH